MPALDLAITVTSDAPLSAVKALVETVPVDLASEDGLNWSITQVFDYSGDLVVAVKVFRTAINQNATCAVKVAIVGISRPIIKKIIEVPIGTAMGSFATVVEAEDLP